MVAQNCEMLFSSGVEIWSSKWILLVHMKRDEIPTMEIVTCKRL